MGAQRRRTEGAKERTKLTRCNKERRRALRIGRTIQSGKQKTVFTQKKNAMGEREKFKEGLETKGFA